MTSHARASGSPKGSGVSVEVTRRPWVRRVRPAALVAHRWLGLALGTTLALLGLTGVVNVFRPELDELLHPELRGVPVADPLASIDDVVAALERAQPGRPGPWMLVAPHGERGMITAWYDEPEERPRFHAPLVVTLDPRSARVVASGYWGETVLTWIYDLHATLALGKTGWYAVGALGVALLASVLLAYPLAWPGWARLGEAFKVRAGASAKRRNYDLHRASGAWSWALLAILAVTGFCIVYGDLAAAVTAAVSPPRQPLPIVRSEPSGDGRKVLASEAIAAARRAFPGAVPKLVRTPAGADGTWQVSVRQPGELNHHYPATAVWIDRHTGAVLGTRDPRRFGAGETFLSILYPLHNGSALGLPGRVLVALSGLAPSILLVTGLRACLGRRRRRAASSVTAAQIPTAS
jgi:uncharacterized iron-regulated membrane protein